MRAVVFLALISIQTYCGAAVVVTVTNSQRRPVGGATVWVVPCDRHGGFLAPPTPLRTDAQEQVSFAPEAQRQGDWNTTHFLLWVKKDDQQSQPQTYSLAHPPFSPPSEPPRPVLQPTVKVPLRVKVTDPQGRPVKGAQVLLWRVLGAGGLSPLLGTWVTNEAGQVLTVVRLPEPFVRTARLHGLPLQFFALAYHPAEGWAWSVVNTDGLSDLHLQLLPSEPATLQVRDCFGDPAEKLRGRLSAVTVPDVPFLVPLPAFRFTFATDTAGTVVLPLPRAGKGLWEWSQGAPWGLRATAATAWLNAGATQSIAFHYRTLCVTGRLLNARTGEPLKGESIVLSVFHPLAMSAVLKFLTRTGDEGRFVVETKPSRYAFSAAFLRFPDGRRLTLRDSPEPRSSKPVLSQSRCERWVIGDFALDPSDAEVTGVVVDDKGKPVPFAFVQGTGVKPRRIPKATKVTFVRVTSIVCDGKRWEGVKQVTADNEGFPFAFAFADQQGRFEMKLRAGTWELSALRTSPPHCPPYKVPERATVLLPLSIGAISPRKVSPTRLEIAAGAKVKVVLTLRGWAHF